MSYSPQAPAFLIPPDQNLKLEIFLKLSMCFYTTLTIRDFQCLYSFELHICKIITLYKVKFEVFM